MVALEPIYAQVRRTQEDKFHLVVSRQPPLATESVTLPKHRARKISLTKKIVRGNGGRVKGEQSELKYGKHYATYAGYPLMHWVVHFRPIDAHPMNPDYVIELSECPCDPRRRHERLGQKVAVV